jgi:hypothetical protein
LSDLFDSNEDFLPDGSNDGYASGLNRIAEQSHHPLLFLVQRRRIVAPQGKRPDASSDQNLHNSTSIRSSWRIFFLPLVHWLRKTANSLR